MNINTAFCNSLHLFIAAILFGYYITTIISTTSILGVR